MSSKTSPPQSWPDFDAIVHPTRRTVFTRIQTPRLHSRLTIGIVGFILLSIVLLAFVPWQQSVVGSGSVTAFDPSARPQTLESSISGRIVRWYVNEGAQVAAGDTICVLADINVNFMDRDLLSRLSELRDRTFEAQEQAINVATQRRKQSEERYNQARARFQNVIVEINTARIRQRRADTLLSQDLISRREWETAQLNLQKALADSVTAAASINVALQDVDAFRAEEERVISQAIVAMQDADVKLANAQGRIGAGTVVAPVDGYVVRINKVGAGQTVKEGEQLAVIVPTSQDQAAEIYVSSMDAALISPGRIVSLQFSGFPAFQFSGWQNIAVGIFHGRVKVIDAVDDGTGRFRVLIVPDSAKKDWPSMAYLRPGTAVTGWVLLNEVPLGYELWRQFMGFPPQFPVENFQKGKAVTTKALDASNGKGANGK